MILIYAEVAILSSGNFALLAFFVKRGDGSDAAPRPQLPRCGKPAIFDRRTRSSGDE
jgi:hypothetical protein